MKLTSGTGRALLPSRPVAVPLTLSGNEQTPATRAAGTQGDGLTGVYAGSSIGVWEATTNLVTNGGAETNVTGVTVLGSNTVARSTAQAKFGSASFLCTYQDNITVFRWTITLTAVAHSYHLWVYVPSNYDGTQLKLNMDGFTGLTAGADPLVDMTKRDQWQWVKFENVLPDSGDLTGNLNLYEAGTPPTAGRFIYVDGVQCEAQPLATPYVHTDGGTASRSASTGMRIYNPRRYFNETQGWFALGVRWGFAYTQTPHASTLVYMGSWGTAGTTRQFFYWSGSNIICRRINGANNGQVQQADADHARGDIGLLLFAWEQTTLKSSVNGAAFATGSVSADTIPDLSGQSYFSIGRDDQGTSELDSAVVFAALGRGTLTDANAAAINRIARNNRIDSRVEDLPGGCTFKWPSENWREGMAL